MNTFVNYSALAIPAVYSSRLGGNHSDMSCSQASGDSGSDQTHKPSFYHISSTPMGKKGTKNSLHVVDTYLGHHLINGILDAQLPACSSFLEIPY